MMVSFLALYDVPVLHRGRRRFYDVSVVEAFKPQAAEFVAYHQRRSGTARFK